MTFLVILQDMEKMYLEWKNLYNVLMKLDFKQKIYQRNIKVTFCNLK